MHVYVYAKYVRKSVSLAHHLVMDSWIYHTRVGCASSSVTRWTAEHGVTTRFANLQ